MVTIIKGLNYYHYTTTRKAASRFPSLSFKLGNRAAIFQETNDYNLTLMLKAEINVGTAWPKQDARRPEAEEGGRPVGRPRAQRRPAGRGGKIDSTIQPLVRTPWWRSVLLCLLVFCGIFVTVLPTSLTSDSKAFNRVSSRRPFCLSSIEVHPYRHPNSQF